VPAFMVVHHAVLRCIAALHPGTEGELLLVKGIGPRTLEKYGTELLALVAEQAEK